MLTKPWNKMEIRKIPEEEDKKLYRAEDTNYAVLNTSQRYSPPSLIWLVVSLTVQVFRVILLFTFNLMIFKFSQLISFTSNKSVLEADYRDALFFIMYSLYFTFWTFFTCMEMSAERTKTCFFFYKICNTEIILLFLFIYF